MRIGVISRQTELAGDVWSAVRGRQVEALGHRHLLVRDHPVGAAPAVHTGWNGP